MSGCHVVGQGLYHYAIRMGDGRSQANKRSQTDSTERNVFAPSWPCLSACELSHILHHRSSEDAHYTPLDHSHLRWIFPMRQHPSRLPLRHCGGCEGLRLLILESPVVPFQGVASGIKNGMDGKEETSFLSRLHTFQVHQLEQARELV